MEKVAALIVSIYVAIVIYTNTFFIKALTVLEGSDQLFWNHLAIFLIVLIPTFFLVNRYISHPYSRGAMRSVRPFLLTLSLIGLLISVLYHIVPLEPVYDLPDQVDKVFASDLAFAIWLIVPILALFI